MPWDSVRGFTEVQVDTPIAFPHPHVIEGDQVGQAGPSFYKPRLSGPDHPISSPPCLLHPCLHSQLGNCKCQGLLWNIILSLSWTIKALVGSGREGCDEHFSGDWDGQSCQPECGSWDQSQRGEPGSDIYPGWPEKTKKPHGG